MFYLQRNEVLTNSVFFSDNFLGDGWFKMPLRLHTENTKPNIVTYIHLGEAGKDDFQNYVEGKEEIQLQVKYN